MAIRKDVLAFIGGALRKVDLDEKGRVAGSKQVGEKPAPAPGGPEAFDPHKATKKDLMAKLKERGITFKATLSAANLAALYVEGPKAAEQKPAAKPEAKPEDAPKSTGDQDVF